MKLSGMIRSCVIFLLIVISCKAFSQSNPPNWTTAQLEQPADLSKALIDHKNIPVIINVGPGAVIPRSLNAGMISEPGGVEKFLRILSKLDKDEKVVIYCGCCPFDHCPNVRPAIDLLKKEGFQNYFLLNLPKNINTDWISKGYPVLNN